MKIVKLDCSASRDELLGVIANSELVNDKVRFDEEKGRPRIHLKQKGDRLKIKCEMIGGATKDNGFLEGTYFLGKLIEINGTSHLRGIILTAPIYHTFIALIMVIYVLRCIQLVAFNPVPIILLIFSLMMFRKEFEKQGTIERYLRRAVKRAERPKV